MLQRIKMLLNKPIAQQIIQYKKSKKLSKQTVLHFGFFIRNHYKAGSTGFNRNLQQA